MSLYFWEFIFKPHKVILSQIGVNILFSIKSFCGEWVPELQDIQA